MNTVKIRWLTGIAAVVGGLGLSALGVPAASAQSAPPTLTGEVLTVGGTGGSVCDNSGPFSFTVSGTASGPYSGTFSETASGTVASNRVTSYTASFTITSATGDVTGTETLTGSIDGCYHSVSEFVIGGSTDYRATINVSAGAYTDQGTSHFLWATPVSGGPVTGGEDFTSSQAQTTPVAPDLKLSDSAPGTAVSGQPYSYTLTATNTGGSDATGVTVTDTLPATAHFNSATISQGTCTGPSTPKGGTVSCAVGTLAAGASATITITVTPTKPGTISDSAQVTASNVSPSDSDDSASASTTVQGT